MSWHVLALSLVLASGIAVGGLIATGGSGTALGAATTLTIISGEVLVRHGFDDFAPAADGAVLRAGDTIRTGDEARAVITYFEGSTVTIEPKSELFIETASSADDGSVSVVMVQYLGRTWHVVTRLIGGSSRYDVRSPASIASVRGTAFEFSVSPDGTTDVTTTEGRVATADAAGTATVVVAPGQTTTVNPGAPPDPPRPAPEPQRKVTVTVGAANTLVVDPLGRTNGVKDGKVVLQTPGSQVKKEADGKLAIVMPNIPDGKLATVATKKTKTSARVEVETTVEEKGKPVARVQEAVRPAAGVASSGVEVSKVAAVIAPPDGTAEKAARKAAERAAREAAARAARAQHEAERAARDAQEKAAEAAEEAERAAREAAARAAAAKLAADAQAALARATQASAEASKTAIESAVKAKLEAQETAAKATDYAATLAARADASTATSEAAGRAAKDAAERAQRASKAAAKATTEASGRSHEAREAAVRDARDAAKKALKEPHGAKKPTWGRL